MPAGFGYLYDKELDERLNFYFQFTGRTHTHFLFNPFMLWARASSGELPCLMTSFVLTLKRNRNATLFQWKVHGVLFKSIR